MTSHAPVTPSGVSLKRAFAGQKSVPRFRYLDRGTAKSPNRNTDNGHAECRKYTPRSHISCFVAENYQFSCEAKNALARKSGGPNSGKQVRPKFHSLDRYQRSIAAPGNRLAARPQPTFRLYQKITLFWAKLSFHLPPPSPPHGWLSSLKPDDRYVPVREGAR